MTNHPAVSREAQASDVTVVLTATIDPKLIRGTGTKRVDPAVRLRDYRNAFRLWLANESVKRIVFCENSGSDLSSICELYQPGRSGKEVEFLSFAGQDFDPSFGKCFGELSILAHVAAHSELLRSCPYMLKVTGRLYVGNIARLILRLSRRHRVDVCCNLVENLSYSDSRVFGCTKTFLQECLLPQRPVANESIGMNFEKILARAVHQGLSSGMTWEPLPLAPRFFGVSGTSNVQYNASFAYWLSREFYRMAKAIILAR
jgi:hypothetical protein